MEAWWNNCRVKALHEEKRLVEQIRISIELETWEHRHIFYQDPGGMVFSDWWLRHNPPSLRGRPPRLRGARLSRPAGGTQEMRAGGACLWGLSPQELGGEASAPQGKAPLGLKQFVVQQSFQLCSALLEHRPKLYFSTSVSFCLSTVYNMAPAEGAPDEPGIDNPEQPPSGTNSELAELKRMFMDSQMESREREKRMCAALQSRNTLTEAGKLARVPPGTCYSSALVVQNCQLQKSDQ
ncbi:hypothetical protein COCOBI_13-2610 [Coccomyxa sp. Obi]|nr:hypothetical protein COCOBI_13-2610 [Coccomyxa sp. Obi]